MEKFIDIHCHLLPRVDDGAANMEDAVALMNMAVEDGTGLLVLTPHYRGRYRKNTPQELAGVLERLKKKAPKGLELRLGCEVGYEPEVAEKLTEGRVLTMDGGKYVLLELDIGVTPLQVIAAVQELLGGGYIPILAHIERFPVFLKNKNLVLKTQELGALIQINGDSVMGRWGFSVKRYCKWLLTRRLAHFVASDGHDLVHRPPKLGQCYEHIRKKYGEDYASALFWGNARVVLGLDG